MYERNFSVIRKKAITTAKQLLYSKEVIEKIEKAKTESEIYRILHDAREGKK